VADDKRSEKINTPKEFQKCNAKVLNQSGNMFMNVRMSTKMDDASVARLLVKKHLADRNFGQYEFSRQA
jgi:hypothetical protein